MFVFSNDNFLLPKLKTNMKASQFSTLTQRSKHDRSGNLSFCFKQFIRRGLAHCCAHYNEACTLICRTFLLFADSPYLSKDVTLTASSLHGVVATGAVVNEVLGEGLASLGIGSTSLEPDLRFSFVSDGYGDDGAPYLELVVEPYEAAEEYAIELYDTIGMFVSAVQCLFREHIRPYPTLGVSEAYATLC